MLYLIKSIKWTKHHKKDTYWGPNESGYTSIIADAGFYEKDKAEKIVRFSSGNAEMIPVTSETLGEAYRQLKRKRMRILNDRVIEDNRHNSVYAELDKMDNAVDNGHARLNSIAERLGI